MDGNDARALPARLRSTVLISLAAWTVLAVSAGSPLAQNVAQGEECPAGGAEFVNPPEIQAADGLLKGSIYLHDERQRLTRSVNGVAKCSTQWVRNFRPTPPKEPRDLNELREPMPGPTLRAGVGDLVQLTFVNQIDSGQFEEGLDIEKCTQVDNGETYPKPFGDTQPPNCLHASITSNIHFHGTHTNPNSTGDNVYLQIRPLPRNPQGRLTTTAEQATVDFNQYFNACAERLKAAPLSSWPVTWSDLPKRWTDAQTALLKAYQTNNDSQRLWDQNEAVLHAGGWPIYYIGAFPYCFALPSYSSPAGKSPVMGQSPGTQWYHAHKHGSTAINVMNGMTGAFIIEGKYDDDLNEAYGSYSLTSGPWKARTQKVMVLNQLGTVANALIGGGDANPTGIDFSVNGRLNPKLHMQPGEVQLWRIVNTSGRTAAYFMPPQGFEWRQIAQDGVQYDDPNYQRSLNRPFYMAPANRVDLLVKAPLTPAEIKVRIKNVMGRSSVMDAQSDSVRELLTVVVSGPPVTKGGQPAEMPFLASAPQPPAFLAPITDDEFKLSGSIRRTFEFNSKAPKELTGPQHTINGIQFDDKDGHASIAVVLGAVEEWKIVNSTSVKGGPFVPIDHPLHIHINPFQVTEMFDPNEQFIDQATGKFVFRYVFDPNVKLVEGQCRLHIDDEESWKPCHDTRQGHWWDVFPIPAGRVVPFAEGSKVVPGYYKMRSRFVDYPGLYVMHCHILIHEDRGMMYSVEVVKPAGAPVHR